MKDMNVALIANANVGKTTIFNKLCGLNQKTGNYPGVTVDKKIGNFFYEGANIQLTDFPGFSSLSPTSKDEELVVSYLLDKSKSEKVDHILFIANANDLKKSLYLFSQVKDLGFPMTLVINMSDVAKRKGIFIDVDDIEKELGIKTILLSAKKDSLHTLKKTILKPNLPGEPVLDDFVKKEFHQEILNHAKKIDEQNLYLAYLDLSKNDKKLKNKEAVIRYQKINDVLEKAVVIDQSQATDLTSRLDRIFLHKVWGYVFFLLIMFLIFQSVFWLATYPMDWIDIGMSSLKDFTASVLPDGMLSDLIVDGMLEGLAGVVIFIPQIAILFFLFSLLEESGYMSRVVFLMDKFMQKLGMSGKSIVPIIGSFACAVPSIMGTRTISNHKERLITILVSPLITCSARIPVYTIIIAIIIPDEQIAGLSLQGIVLFAMYLLGIIALIFGALIFKLIIKGKYKSFFILDMPEYLRPDFKVVSQTVWNNCVSFVCNAGKIIVAVTIIIFVLKSNGNSTFENVENYVSNQSWSESQKNEVVTLVKEQNSYLAMGGKFIEPVIEPLGYDWKIGIGVIASIAAREVFIGTMMVIYGGNEDEMEEDMLIADRLRMEINENTGDKTFNFATGISLLLFYAFSLQCMSTIAVTFKETKSLKWTSIQFLYMTILAYMVAFIAYQTLI